MSGVEQQLATVGEPAHVEPSGPLRLRKAGCDGLRRHGDAPGVEHMQDPDGDRGVRALVGAPQSEREPLDVGR